MKRPGFVVVLAALALGSTAWCEDAAFDRYPCFVTLARIHAGSAVGGDFEGIGQLYLVPGSKAGRPGLYLLNATMSRFVGIERPPSRSKDDFVLILDIVSHHEYGFIVRHEGAGSRFERRGWSIENDANNRERPKKQRRVTVLLGGRDPGTEDAIAAEIREAIPHLNDRFEVPFTHEIDPVITTFTRDFYPAFDVLNACAKDLPGDDRELRVAAAVEQVELLQSLDRAVRNVIPDEDDPDWPRDLEDVLTDELCRRLACRNDATRQEVRQEAERLVERFSDLQRLIASVRRTHGEKWRQPLLRQLLYEADVDSASTEAIVKRW